MKTSVRLLVVLFCLSAASLLRGQQPANSGPAPALPDPTPYSITQRDGNSRVWQRETYDKAPNGNIVTNVHKYTELATGLNHLVDGQWVASTEEIDLSPDGNSAAATNGQHQAYFPGDIAQGVIELDTPDGLKLQSRPIALSYDDGSNTVMIAVLTNSAGELLGTNQVIYPNAFEGATASLRYTYTLAGLEQDVLIQEQLPPPESFGLDSTNTRLQMLTEFFGTNNPVQTPSPIKPQDGLSDTFLTFGQMKMMRGRAFSIGDSAPSPRRNRSLPIYKSWVKMQGRTFLVEEVPYWRISAQLQTLPAPANSPAATSYLPSANSCLYKVSAIRLLPPAQLSKSETSPSRQSTAKAGNQKSGIFRRLAKADPTLKRGVVLDYVVINSNLGSYTFLEDTTYYVSGEYSASGTLTFQGGTVIKLDGNGEIDMAYTGGITCNTGPYRPAVFTSINDNSVGETITNSTGTPSCGDVGTFLSVDLFSLSLNDMRFCYSNLALNQYDGEEYSSLGISDCQFVNGDIAIQCGYVTLENVLFSSSQDDWAVEFSGVGDNALTAENVTVDGYGTFAQSYSQGWWPSGEVPIVVLNNCLLSALRRLESSDQHG